MSVSSSTPLSSRCDLTQGGRTLRRSLRCQGIGLHSGQKSEVQLHPLAPGQGRRLQRRDLPGSDPLRLSPEVVQPSPLCTQLAQGEVSAQTVEHLLAALAARGITDVLIDLDGPEVPILDGSARDWIEAIDAVGVTPGHCPEAVPTPLAEPIWIQDGEAFVAALPAPQLRLSYGIDFAAAAIGQQWHTWTPVREDFAQEIAPARTFGLAHEVESLRSRGLIRGGCLDNALVCDGDHWLNPPLRFANEPVRHKILDLVGDLSLLGRIPVAHILAYKASHRLHGRLAQCLRSRGYA
ncbi:MAG: UDP-3-O-[3-hydroxymyristoyl] N-acetylglucosamine deacetylase LpxC [Phormidium sp. OSCR]|nr:MAG: UDP-3-O-[3-hydroxymyristoyl] N-acetylglucosamine deacetylase LpxC [Phormidium sp. OSCR]